MHPSSVERQPLFTIGHGTLPADELGGLLAGAGVRRLVDVRRFPGSRRHPHVGRAALAGWLPDYGIAYRWEEALGGRRRADPESANVGLRNETFRGYADHMATAEFRAAADRLVAHAAEAPTAVLCSESLWWRCHRRLLADHLVLVAGLDVRHLLHSGALVPHELTETARRQDGRVVYTL
jgi:uncharacterized protein (DUF488 family)